MRRTRRRRTLPLLGFVALVFCLTSVPFGGSAVREIRNLISTVDKSDDDFALVEIHDAVFRVPISRTPGAIEIGKRFIAFCYQQDDICYAGEEATGIIEDSDETYREIQELIGAKK